MSYSHALVTEAEGMKRRRYKQRVDETDTPTHPSQANPASATLKLRPQSQNVTEERT